jgi:hypothetical protein
MVDLMFGEVLLFEASVRVSRCPRKDWAKEVGQRLTPDQPTATDAYNTPRRKLFRRQLCFF